MTGYNASLEDLAQNLRESLSPKVLDELTEIPTLTPKRRRRRRKATAVEGAPGEGESQAPK